MSDLRDAIENQKTAAITYEVAIDQDVTVSVTVRFQPAHEMPIDIHVILSDAIDALGREFTDVAAIKARRCEYCHNEFVPSEAGEAVCPVCMRTGELK